MTPININIERENLAMAESMPLILFWRESSGWPMWLAAIEAGERSWEEQLSPVNGGVTGFASTGWLQPKAASVANRKLPGGYNTGWPENAEIPIAGVKAKRRKLAISWRQRRKAVAAAGWLAENWRKATYGSSQHAQPASWKAGWRQLQPAWPSETAMSGFSSSWLPKACWRKSAAGLQPGGLASWRKVQYWQRRWLESENPAMAAAPAVGGGDHSRCHCAIFARTSTRGTRACGYL